MLASFPPGVTGNEKKIAGPDREHVEVRFCDSCQEDTEHEIWLCGRIEDRECRVCLHEFEREIGPDSF